jgi:hypothetical protein
VFKGSDEVAEEEAGVQTSVGGQNSNELFFKSIHATLAAPIPVGGL